MCIMYASSTCAEPLFEFRGDVPKVWLKKFGKYVEVIYDAPGATCLRAYVRMCSAMRKTKLVNRTPRGFPWGRYHRAVKVNQ